MDYSSSDTEEENMETLLASKMNRSPSPSPAPPSIEALEVEYQSIENSASCTEFIIDVKGLMTNLDNYVFVSAVTKDNYYNELLRVFKNSTDLHERLRNAELERLNAAIRTIDLTHGIPSKSNPFTTVKGRKGNRKTPTPPPERQTNKKLKTEEVIDTTNRYDSLPVEDPLIDEENEDDDPAPHVPKYRKPPPITIDNVANSAALLKKLQTLTREDFMGRVIGRGLRVYPNTSQAYHAIRSYIDREKLESFTYQLSEEKELKAVIRGMPSDMPPTNH
ncbi:hypothetical protein TNCV_2620921 [Trichonephila clavipes]|uniref:Uncharacterized protein n=1 Tax=Trichonephila clavipes TaxID=2585209 RepID=A0A8X6WBT0_TRICX|nr:hypothetical protein TNCV_2620921 [Trichonephila clavipes]